MKSLPVAKLGSLTSLISSGSTPLGGATRYLSEGPVMFIRSQNVRMNCLDLSDVVYIDSSLHEEMKRTHVRSGDVFINITGASIGRVAAFDRNGDKANVNQHVCIIRPKSEMLDFRYLTTFLCSPRFQEIINRLQRGGTRQALTFDMIANFDIPLPSLTEQRRIAAILDKADAIRRKREEGIRLTEELLRSTFLEMFGDPATNPKGWPIRVMGEVVKETQYGTAEKSNSDGTGIPVLRMNNITYGGDIDLTDIKWSEINDTDLDQLTVKRGDLLFNRTNSPELVGKTAVWDRDEPYAYAGYLFRVRFDEKVVLPDYVSAFLNSAYGKKMLFAKAKPSNNMSNFSAGEFCRIDLPVPEIALQRRFAKTVAQAKSLKTKRLTGRKEAESLFGSLVQRAFRGELTNGGGK